MSARADGAAVATLLGLVALRGHLLRRGATREEARQALPGDGVVRARWQSTHGATVAAPPDAVWPWLVQLGWGRGGWYSLDLLERMVGAGSFAEGGSARRVVPELQGLTVGDTVPLSAAGGLSVLTLDAPRALVLHLPMDLRTGGVAGPASPAVLDWTWAFSLQPVGAARTRLLVRVRADYRPRWVRVPLVLLVEPVHLLMEGLMLRTLARRVEGAR